MNLAVLTGNVGVDPEVHTFPDGNRVVSFPLATSIRWKDKNTGEKKEHTDWHRIETNKPGLCDVLTKYVKTGQRLTVRGRIKYRKWTDNEGIDRYATAIIAAEIDLPPNPNNSREANTPLATELDDEIPF